MGAAEVGEPDPAHDRRLAVRRHIRMAMTATHVPDSALVPREGYRPHGNLGRKHPRWRYSDSLYLRIERGAAARLHGHLPLQFFYKLEAGPTDGASTSARAQAGPQPPTRVPASTLSNQRARQSPPVRTAGGPEGGQHT